MRTFDLFFSSGTIPMARCKLLDIYLARHLPFYLKDTHIASTRPLPWTGASSPPVLASYVRRQEHQHQRLTEYRSPEQSRRPQLGQRV